jgi:hypothetical protein
VASQLRRSPNSSPDKLSLSQIWGTSGEIWDLCYQVCFLNYFGSHGELETKTVEVDTSLIDMAAQTPDWHKLDNKANEVIANLFNNLPQLSQPD